MKETLPEVQPQSNSLPDRAHEWWNHVRTSETVRYFIGRGSYLLPLNFLGLVLGVVSTVLYARFLAPEQYGQFSYVISTVTILNFLGLPGIQTAIAQAAAQNCDGFFARGTRARLRLSLVGSLVVAAVGILCWRTKGAEVGLSFLIAAALFPAYWAFDGYMWVLSGKKQFGELSVLRLIQMLSVAGVTWTTLLLTRQVPWVFAANFGTTALTNFIFHRLTLRRHIHNDNLLPGSMGFGKRLSALSVLISIEGRVDNVMLGTFLPFQTLGWFNMASRINDASMRDSWTVVAQLLLPRLAEVSDAEAHRRARVWGIYLIAAFLLLAALFWLLAPVILPWILGPRYRDSIRLAQWLVLIHAISVPWSVFEVWANARAYEKGLWLTRLVVAGLHLATLPPLLNLWGVSGVLISIVVSRVGCVVACIALFFRRKI